MVTLYSVEAVKKNVGNSMIIMSGNQTFVIGFGQKNPLFIWDSGLSRKIPLIMMLAGVEGLSFRLWKEDKKMTP